MGDGVRHIADAGEHGDLREAHGRVLEVGLLAHRVPLGDRQLVGCPGMVGVVPVAVVERDEDVPGDDVTDFRLDADSSPARRYLDRIPLDDPQPGGVLGSDLDEGVGGGAIEVLRAGCLGPRVELV